MSRLLLFTLLTLHAAILVSTTTAQPLFRENFGGDTAKGTLIPTEPTPDTCNGWYAPANTDDSVNGSRPHVWTWGHAKEKLNMAVTFQSRAQPEEQRWLFRKLTTGGPLAQGRAVTNPKLTALFNMAWGGNTSGNCYNLALLDDSGKGYVAQISRSGTATLYRLDNGLTGGWTILGTKDSEQQFNTNLISLSVSNGKVTVASKLITMKNAPGPELTETDTTYTRFTTIGFAGIGFQDAIDTRIRDVTLEGQVVSNVAEM
ncbi:hypothetical protein [Geminisphaera colitermitum]|uniref:hypothetical protein n=1 Tax=Geminisphaera colitermitum TaxID=1148786 RepID=UPI000196545D|nr:hypothetical protein [Geminisphaera colitermitum]